MRNAEYALVAGTTSGVTLVLVHQLLPQVLDAFTTVARLLGQA